MPLTAKRNRRRPPRPIVWSPKRRALRRRRPTRRTRRRRMPIWPASAPNWPSRGTASSAARRNWTTTASGPPASSTNGCATPTWHCCATCCRWWTTWTGPSTRPRRTPTPRHCWKDSKWSTSNLATPWPATIAGRSTRSMSRSIRTSTTPSCSSRSADHPPNTVLMVTQNGYELHDRVVRPSQVIVSKAE